MTDYTFPAGADRARCLQYMEKLGDLAEKNERCPNVDHWRYLGFKNPQILGDMARAGMIRIEVTLHNYRTITLCQGPHAGKSTRPPEQRTKPYKVISRERP